MRCYKYGLIQPVGFYLEIREIFRNVVCTMSGVKKQELFYIVWDVFTERNGKRNKGTSRRFHRTVNLWFKGKCFGEKEITTAKNTGSKIEF